ncbi:MAG TPA: DNA methyltransferase [Verrucomicrobiae bacterium]|nr:DNA methyltransferase [Verrucomicrobiae bacterium]
MTSLDKALQSFADFAAKLRGDEKSEAQTFLFHLLAAFGNDPNTLPEGATFEYRVRFAGDRTKFADLVWPGRCLIEMKSRGAKLSKHYQQTFDYWLNLVPHRPPYVVLCNFDEFWIYDFNTQLQEPVDRLPVAEIVPRHAALNFLFPRPFQPLFKHNWVEVTREAARDVAHAFNSLVFRGEDRVRARRFILQSVVAMFAEDIGLLPQDLFTRLLDECRRGASSYDLIGGLFRQMNDPKPARAGRYAGVEYFNGGLFATVDPIELQPAELGPLFEAANGNNWGRVQPVIFGTLFESSLGKEERHALGAHFTYESDIQKIVRPTIVRPWDERIDAAKNAPDLLSLLKGLREFRVLDPACGSGNFLFVAYRALREIEQRLLLRLFAQDKRQFPKVGLASGISPKNFFGIDINENAVETAKVTLMLARRLAHRDAEKFWADHADELPGQDTHSLEFERDLPLDNLDANIICADALFTPWPEADAIIGNPPFLGSRYLAKEHGYAYARKVHTGFPEVPKMADFCVYWFRLAHDNLGSGGRAGLVGTKTIRQNESRQASLGYIVNHGGTVTEAVSHQVWSGEAAVHVSLVNWIKGEQPGTKKLYTQIGDAKDSPWKCEQLEAIGPTLSSNTDASAAKPLHANQEPKLAYVGQYPFNEGFWLEPQQAAELIRKDPNHRDVLFPYMIGRDLVEAGRPGRWIIDFGQREMTDAMRYQLAFERVKKLVMPVVLAKAEKEKAAVGKDSTRWTRLANRWWRLRDYQPGTMAAISKVPRYIACSRVTKRPIFEFISPQIHPDNTLVVFSFADDYSFGILQSGIHWAWFTAKCSTLTARFRYTSDTVFDTFPWPQFPAPKPSAKGTPNHQSTNPSIQQSIRAVAKAAVALRALRREIMTANGWSLRDLYRTLETPGANRLRDAHAALDSAVRSAYGMKDGEDTLAFLLRLNLECAAKEAKGEPITPPGLPGFASQPSDLVTSDCISVEQPGTEPNQLKPTTGAA